jgi:hypothetical protein
MNTNNGDALQRAFEAWWKENHFIWVPNDLRNPKHVAWQAFQHAHKLAWNAQQAEITPLKKDVSTLQCAIDRLMLEFCPDEMTAEQVEEWGKHQSRYTGEHQ